MGLKIGKWLKKNVRFKNVVKLAKDVVPGVGGQIIGNLSDAHEAKKAARQEAEQAKREALLQSSQDSTNRAGTLMGEQVGTIAGNFARTTMRAAYDGLNTGVKEGVAYAGASVVDMTITEWLKQNWWKVLLGVLTLGLALKFIIKPKSSNRRRKW